MGKRLYEYRYREAELAAWADKLRPHLPGRTLYAFFNNTYRADATANAVTLRELLAG